MQAFSDELYHYGVLGMKWGVRRTPEELGHRKSSTSDAKVRSITRTWNKADREMMALYGKKEYETSPNLAYRKIQYSKGVPVSFIDIEDYGSFYNVSIGTRSGKQYRGKGYATKNLEDGLKWWEENQSKIGDKPLSWWAKNENIGSQRLAINAGFTQDFLWRQPGESDDEWKHYLKKG